MSPVESIIGKRTPCFRVRDVCAVMSVGLRVCIYLCEFACMHVQLLVHFTSIHMLIYLSRCMQACLSILLHGRYVAN